MKRQRSTWVKKASAAPAVPFESGGHPAEQPDPNEHDYENGDTSSWNEDPKPGPYTQSGHPATPDEGITHPAAKKARLTPKQAAVMQKRAEVKAAKCVKMATAFLGEDADEGDVEDQALAFMDLDDAKVEASLNRLSEDVPEDEEADDDEEAMLAAMLAEEEEKDDEADDVEEEPEPETDKTASLKRRLAKAEAQLRKLAEEDEPEEEDDPEVASLKKRLAKVEALLKKATRKAADDEPETEEETEDKTAGQNEPDAFYTDKGKEADDGNEDLDDEEKAMLAEMTAEEDDGDEDLDDEEKAMLAEMLAEEETEEKPEETEAEEPEEAEGKEACDACDGTGEDLDGIDDIFIDDADMVPELEEPIVLDGDPMGMLADDVEFTPEDEADLASLYASDETEEVPVEKTARAKTASRKVAPKPVPKKVSTGAKKLGSVRTASTEASSLENIWESAPDVSDVFNQ